MNNLKEFIETQATKFSKVDASYSEYQRSKSEFLKFDPKELIIACLNHSYFSGEDVAALLINVPEIWKDLNLNDWKYIIENVNRRADYRLVMDNDACFEDIKFLYKFLEIDSIKLYKEDSNITAENKSVLDRVIPGICTNFFKDDLDEEYFTDGTYGNRYYFREMKKKLITQGAKEAPYIKDAIANTPKLKTYIKSFGSVA